MNQTEQPKQSKIKFESVSFVWDKTTFTRVSQLYSLKGFAMNRCKKMNKAQPGKNYVVWTYDLSWPTNEDMP